MENNYDTLSDTSRVWIYQSNRPFTKLEIQDLRPALKKFAQQWVSHNRQLKAFGEVFYNQFIVLMVDESAAGASGCSIDSSVHFMKQIESVFSVNLFDRMTFTYKDGEEVKTAPRDLFASLYNSGQIGDQTPVFDTLVATKKPLRKVGSNRWGRAGTNEWFDFYPVNSNLYIKIRFSFLRITLI